MTNDELLVLMKEAMTNDAACLVLGDYLEERGITIPECLATEGLALMVEADEKLQRELRRSQRVVDLRVRTREVLRAMGHES